MNYLKRNVKGVKMSDSNLNDDNKKNDNDQTSKKTNNRDGIIDGIFALFELFSTYAKEQLSAIIYKSLLSPIESLKKSVSAAILGAFLYGTAAVFISISFILLLMEFFPKWISYLIVALILISIGLILNKRKTN